MFKWGIIGVGQVSKAFVVGVNASGPNVSVFSVYSRRLEASYDFAEEFNICHVAESVEQLCKSGVDAVYIATPPKYHEEFALVCISFNLHVLIEKPFATNSSGAQRIITAARSKGVFCMEGLWTRFLPLISEIKSLVKNGTIGEIKSFRGEFMAANVPDLKVSQFDPSKGGGALMYRGVYPLSLAQYFLGSIESFKSVVNVGDTGVDEDCALSLRHSSGAISSIRASLRVNGRNDFEINGTLGRINIKGPIIRPNVAFLTLYSPRQGRASNKAGKLDAFRSSILVQNIKQTVDHLLFRNVTYGEKPLIRKYYGNGFVHEIQEFIASVNSGQLESEIMPLNDTLEIVKLMEDLTNEWRTGVTLND
ncbi:Gfo/Idh/MocA family oxidoreductase [Amylibacter sp.]|nr:Gfo/Idh/MocA family oxidoreductase [Amylibacter sp.]